MCLFFSSALGLWSELSEERGLSLSFDQELQSRQKLYLEVLRIVIGRHRFEQKPNCDLKKESIKTEKGSLKGGYTSCFERA